VVAEIEIEVLGKLSDHCGTAIKEELKVAVAIWAMGLAVWG